MRVGAKNLITDIAGLKVGNAEDHVIKTGVTVLTADRPFTASVNVMGGAPGTRETDLLAPDKLVQEVDALVLSGGSAFGLDAASGVMDGLRAVGRGFAVGDQTVPIVPAAILFDLRNGGDKTWDENPYRALGREAFVKANENFSIGSTGAGTGALSARLKGGLGSASVVLASGITVAALVAANPVGSVTTPDDRYFWAAPFEMQDEFGGLGVNPKSALGDRLVSKKIEAFAAGTNTTIAIVATDAKLTKTEAHRVAVASHDGLARAIVPAHTPYDGDLVFAAATGEKELLDPINDLLEIGDAASITLSRAIARAVFEATPTEGDLLPCFQELNKIR